MTTTFSKFRKTLEEGVVAEQQIDPKDDGEYNDEGGMALQQLKTAQGAINDLMQVIQADDNLPEWVQNKLTKAVDYMDSVRDYLTSLQEELTDAEKKEVEKVAKELPDADFKKRYGDKWLSVKIATATNIVKNKKKK
jgi:hypothetical protein